MVFFYVAVPNFDCARFPLTKTFFRVVHTLYFSENTLRFILESNGFDVINLIGTNKDNSEEVYALCKKSNNSNPIIYSPKDYIKSKKKLTHLFKKEEKFWFNTYWQWRTFLIKFIFYNGLMEKVKLRKIIFKWYKWLLFLKQKIT